MKSFQGLIGIGAIQDPIVRESFRALDVWARQVSDTEVEVPEAWPVGSIFISTDARNPSVTLGYGIWDTFGAGRVIVGLNSADTDFDTAEETGGAKTVSAVVADHAAHTHDVASSLATPDLFGADVTGAGVSGRTGNPSATLSHTITATSVVQPYIVAYMWKRRA